MEKWFLKGKFEYFGGNDSECFELISADEPFAFLSGWDLGEAFGQAGKELGGVGVRVLGGAAMLWMSMVPATLRANPQGEAVVGGAAGFNRPDAATLIVNQNTDRAVINWNSFSIANGELTKFVQPSSSSAVLNLSLIHI